MMRVGLWLLLFCLPLGALGQNSPEEMEPQFPQQQSAQDLLTACASSQLTSLGRQRRRYCAGFVAGVEEALRWFSEQKELIGGVCAPPRVTSKALAQAYVAYAGSHRAELDRPAVEVVVKALQAAFPCARGAAGPGAEFPR